jgi:hypothetical protein
MTFDSRRPLRFVPTVVDKGGTLINAYLPYNDNGLPGRTSRAIPTLAAQSGSGDFYEDIPHPVPRPTSRRRATVRLGDRLVRRRQ